MSDYSELKSLLEYAIGYRTDKTTAPDVQKFCRLTELTTPESVLLIVAENESLRRDAERYRWIRGDGDGQDFVCLSTRGEEMDEAVDKKLNRSPENPS